MNFFQPAIIIAAMLLATPAWAADENSKTANEDICSTADLKTVGPKQAIECTVNNIIDTLKKRVGQGALSDQDRDNIRQAIHGRFDYRTMARLSLGSKTWKTLDQDEQAHFIDVNRELLERSYGNRLVEYNDQRVVFENAKLEQKRMGVIAIVKSTVIDGTRKIPVDYKLHQTKTGWQVYEILIEGIAMVRTKYKEYKEVRKNGGYEALIKILEAKLAKLKAKDQN